MPLTLVQNLGLDDTATSTTLRLDTSGDANGSGPRWHTDLRSGSGYVMRHWSGL